MFNLETGQFLTRVWGKTISKGVVKSVSELPTIVYQCFHQIIPCIGITADDLGEEEEEATNCYWTDLPFRRRLSRWCHYAYPLSDDPSHIELTHKLGVCDACESSKTVIKTDIGNDRDITVKKDVEEIVETLLKDDCLRDTQESFKRCDNSKINGKKETKKREKIFRPKKKDSKMMCEICGQSFKSQTILRVHAQSEHLVGSVKCSACSLLLKGVYEYHAHWVNTHPEIQCLNCSNCGASTPIHDYIPHSKGCWTRSTTKKRKSPPRGGSEMLKDGEDLSSVQCDICGKIYSTRGNMEVHRKSHSGEKPFPCDECDYQALSKICLQNHKKIHLRDRGATEDENNVHLYHYCHHCGKRFNCQTGKEYTKYTFAQPEKIVFHSGFFLGLSKHIKYVHDKNWDNVKCLYCDLVFERKLQMRRHVSREHSSDTRFHCKECPKRFASDSELKAHEAVHSGPQFFCKFCGKGLKKKLSLIAHERIHTGENPYS